MDQFGDARTQWAVGAESERANILISRVGSPANLQCSLARVCRGEKVRSSQAHANAEPQAARMERASPARLSNPPELSSGPHSTGQRLRWLPAFTQQAQPSCCIASVAPLRVPKCCALGALKLLLLLLLLLLLAAAFCGRHPAAHANTPPLYYGTRGKFDHGRPLHWALVSAPSCTAAALLEAIQRGQTVGQDADGRPVGRHPSCRRGGCNFARPMSQLRVAGAHTSL